MTEALFGGELVFSVAKELSSSLTTRETHEIFLTGREIVDPIFCTVSEFLRNSQLLIFSPTFLTG